MKLQILTLVVCCATLVANGCATSGLPVKVSSKKTFLNSNAQFSVARAHEQEGDLGSAHRIYAALYEADPKNAAVCHRLGIAKLRMGEVDDGISYLLEANSLDSQNAEVVGDLGYAYIQQGDFKLAEKFLRESLNVSPNNERNVNNLAMSVGYQGRMEECFTLYRKVVDDAQAHANMAYIYSQRGKTDLAIEHYTIALDRDPNLKSAGEALVQMVDIDSQVALAKKQQSSNKIQLASDVSK